MDLGLVLGFHEELILLCQRAEWPIICALDGQLGLESRVPFQSAYKTRPPRRLFASFSDCSLYLQSLVRSIFVKTKLKWKTKVVRSRVQILMRRISERRTRKIWSWLLLKQRGPVGDYIKEADPTLLITSDQVVIYEGVVREKPANEKEAREFIQGYSGGHAATVGSVLVTNLKTGFRKGAWDRVEIYFHEIPDEIIEKLIEEGTVLHVAGGLIIEHPLIKPYVKQVVGTTDSVMGLPKALTQKLIKEAL
ncbi:maf-like protein DDB_G0281937 isoform X1 [Durio zibethinus]|uniref:Maf-like protein DDB_G0281937 isoform X1 n=1 Tax=Durio zibethinus TaxID=66656 RepID=A0A6P6AKQ8_DURZI|nr:maf-like protein DDB_G0281937 isoform X1 [Durio zibethinus]